MGALCQLGNMALRRRNDTFAADDLYRQALALSPGDAVSLCPLSLSPSLPPSPSLPLSLSPSLLPTLSLL